jgi:hypothetical protein
MGHDRHARVRTFAVGVVRDQNKDELYGFRSTDHVSISSCTSQKHLPSQRAELSGVLTWWSVIWTGYFESTGCTISKQEFARTNLPRSFTIY